MLGNVQEAVVVIQLPSCARLFATPWTAAHQASLAFTISQSLLKLMSIGLMIPTNHLILCCPLLLLPSVFPSIRLFSIGCVIHSNSIPGNTSKLVYSQPQVPS